MLRTLHWLSNWHLQELTVPIAQLLWRRLCRTGIPVFRKMFQCVLGCNNQCNAEDVISAEKWKTLKSKTALWKGLDKFGAVNESIPWSNGPDGFHMCDNCYFTLKSNRSLDQARKRQEKGKKRTDLPEHTPAAEENLCQSSSKRLRSSIGGTLQPKNTCVWCLAGADTRHPDRKNALVMLSNSVCLSQIQIFIKILRLPIDLFSFRRDAVFPIRKVSYRFLTIKKNR